MTEPRQNFIVQMSYWRCNMCRAEMPESFEHQCGDRWTQDKRKREQEEQAPMLAEIERLKDEKANDLRRFHEEDENRCRTIDELRAQLENERKELWDWLT